MSGESLLQNLRAAKRRCNFADKQVKITSFIFRETMPVFVP